MFDVWLSDDVRLLCSLPRGVGMEIWYGVGFTETHEIVELAMLAEELGFTGVALPDHLVTPETIDSSYPYTGSSAIWWSPSAHLPDPWVMAAVIASHTTTLKIMTAVYVLPMHELFGTAKAVSTAAYLAGDRLVLGIGVGWMAEEFTLTGQQFDERGRRTEEMVQVLDALFSGAPTSFEGEFYSFPPVTMAPVPSHRIPIVVGGNSPVALRRAAKFDGWLGGGPHDPVELVPLLRSLAANRAAADRAIADRAIADPANPDPGRPYQAMTTLSGPIDSDTLAELAAAGLTGVVTQWFSAEQAAAPLADKRAAMKRTAAELLR
jgi:probable F420-dependent oxidoreductase